VKKLAISNTENEQQRFSVSNAHIENLSTHSGMII